MAKTLKTEKAGKLTRLRHNAKGEEILDPKPIAPPLGYKPSLSLAEQIRRQVIAAKLEALQELAETDEEADDFNIDDEFEPFSPHENEGMPSIRELKKEAARINEAIKQRNLADLQRRLEKEAAPKAPPKPSTSSTTDGS